MSNSTNGGPPKQDESPTTSPAAPSKVVRLRPRGRSHPTAPSNDPPPPSAA
jgi:hypothetical protein